MNSEPMERFDIRLPASAKNMLVKAAEMNGSSMASLVLGAAMDKAREILQAGQMFSLNEREWKRFVDALENPPSPNEALRKAWDEYHADGIE